MIPPAPNASPSVTSNTDEGSPRRVVTFGLNDVLLGIDIRVVQEINRTLDYTAVPGSPRHIAGVVNLRGNVVTVIDAHELLRLTAPPNHDGGHNLILTFDGERIGIPVEGELDILDIDPARLSPRPTNLRAIDARLIESVYLRDNDVVILLDPDAFLAATLPSAESAELPRAA